MKIDVGGTAVEFDAHPGTLKVSLAQDGFDSSSLEVIGRYVDARETDSGITLTYRLAGDETSFRDAAARAQTRLDRLILAQSVVASIRPGGGFKVPLVHPDNVYHQGGPFRVVHVGLLGMLAPMQFDEARFLSSLQAMVLQVFHPKLPFEQLVDGAVALRDKFSVALRQTTTPDELRSYLEAQLKAERADVAAAKVSVPKRRYSLYRVVGILGLVAALATGVFAWQTWTENSLQSDVISAQSRFLASDYSDVLIQLEDRPTATLPASAKYVLAVSSINLHELTAAQKQAILNTISEKSDEVTLNYWIAMGRGEFDQALDYAKNLGDDQLTLLAYTDLYEATKLDTQMAGGTKQELLTEYAEAIDELTAKLDGTSTEAAEQ